MRAGVIGAIAVAGVALFPQAALAGGGSSNCTANKCSVGVADFPGGTISVDVDVSGSGTGVFVVSGPNNFKCSGSFPASGGVRSYVCRNAPAGVYAASVSGPSGPSAVGLRW
ncbi:hypothetical protein [Micromonospora aurantiaca (nom. illeg.)]|uniref:hypothetical protein n=1 Tax=Micromonospora aurantiaca (nom. illeg.) TaxID=47850 RepID=UPI0033FEC4F5